MVEVKVLVVRVDLVGTPPVVVLQEVGDEERVLPIYVGEPEAKSIAWAMEGAEFPRPMTHDLLATTIGELGGTLERVTVTHVIDGTFFAELRVRAGDRVHVISSRTSDAIALALRVRCPIEIDDDVMDEAAVTPDRDSDDDLDEGSDVVEAFREFLEDVDPEDFLR